MKNDTSNQNLEHQAAIEKMQELVKHNSMCLFTTLLTELPLHSRPMSIAKVCDHGNFWFLSAGDSNKNMNISADPRVQLFSTNQSDSEYLTVYGKATITRERKKIEEIWTPIANAWFKDGIDDPRVTVIKVAPEEAYYWDTKNGKMISMIKILASAVSGAKIDDGVQGVLSVN
ncbi:pyridoxamine 5'-phosphate oxidase family protein [soil metagenome]